VTAVPSGTSWTPPPTIPIKKNERSEKEGKKDSKEMMKKQTNKKESEE
jgi:hypothetical protein